MHNEKTIHQRVSATDKAKASTFSTLKTTEPMKENNDTVITEVTEDRFERIGTTYYKTDRPPNAAGNSLNAAYRGPSM